ncbi:hypothetical protein [Variovorax soli]|jgi:hypothetical protein|uniref:hypothetical protein n=1 Tax=Variovorax soli TaxID=376815 RepID=UPI000A04CD08|nr:hypothetical protein [Variovorax soli]
MINVFIRSSVICLGLISFGTFAEEARDSRIVGSWQGMRTADGKCQFLAWKSKFKEDGRFEITFFADAERKKELHTERGTWRASDGRNELKTDGVPTTEVYTYSFADPNTVRYVNTVRDPSADCQADYEFLEHRTQN